MPSLLSPESQNDQSPMACRRVHAHVGEPHVEGKECATLLVANGGQVFVRCSSEALLQCRASVEAERSQEHADFFGQILVDFDPSYAAPGFRGALPFRASAAA